METAWLELYSNQKFARHVLELVSTLKIILMALLLTR